MSEKKNPAGIPGFSLNDTIAMAAAFYCARSTVDVDWDKAMVMMGSNCVKTAKERVRVAKKKKAGVSLPAGKPSIAPAGGVDKKAAGKVNNTPKKATKPKAKSKEMIKEEDRGEDMDGDDA